jgi:hypothetical protein
VKQLYSEYYVVLAFDQARSTDQLRGSLGRVDVNLRLQQLIDGFARDLFADDTTAHWAARLQFIPRP